MLSDQNAPFFQIFVIFSIVLWTFLFLYARRHRVMRIIKPKQKPETVANEDSSKHESEEEHTQSSPDDIITERLTRLMEVNNVYLNPKVSLGDVAIALCTNKTYLSDYFNNSLNTTFYDYINTYRIAEACRIIEAMPTEGRKPMSSVAELSGFNSLSTFNRYFVKVKGVTPKSYYSSNEIVQPD